MCRMMALQCRILVPKKLKIFNQPVVGPVPAYDKVWFFGDEFIFRSYKEYFQKRRASKYGGYIKEHYDTKGFVNSKYASADVNMVSRMRNLMTQAIKDQVLLPKFIVIVMDNDLIKYLDLDGYGVDKSYGRMVNNIMTEHERVIQTQREFLPTKSKKDHYPMIIWIEAPMHENYANNLQRNKFNKCLNTMASFHRNVISLHLKKVWTLLIQTCICMIIAITQQSGGPHRTVKYADTILCKKLIGLNAAKKSATNNKTQDRY